MPESPQHLFVYGTLRPGQHAMADLLASGASRVGPGTIQGRLFLVDDYPGAIWSADPQDRVHGEVFRLAGDADEVLCRLDEYEHYDPRHPATSLFVRGVGDVRLSDGTRLPAWIYYFNGVTRQLTPIPSGDFFEVQSDARRARPA